MPPGLRFHDPKDVRRPAAQILRVPFGEVARTGRPGGADIGVEGHGLLIQAHHRLLGIVGLLVERQHVFPPGYVPPPESPPPPLFFPATASGRGFGAGSGWSRGLPAAPSSAAPPVP